MQTITIQVHNRDAMKVIRSMEERNAISIVRNGNINMESPGLPGKPFALKSFKDWIAAAEAAPSITIEAARSEWGKQRKEFQHLTTK